MDYKNTISILSYLFDHLEGLAGLVALMWAVKTWKRDNKAKELEIELNLDSSWDDQWSLITAFPITNKELFAQNFQQVEDENIRVSIIKALNIIKRAHNYYTRTGVDIRSTEWDHRVRKICKKHLFVTAFEKTKGSYSKNFQTYMESHIRPENVKQIKIHKQKEQKKEAQ